MDNSQYLKNLENPNKIVDVVLDTDMFNEIDDQFALSYILKSKDRMNLLAVFAAPFLNKKVSSSSEGMLKSYNEILKVLVLNGYKKDEMIVCKGSNSFLQDINEPLVSQASSKLIELANKHTPENPLYVIEIANCVNVASAMLLDPSICDKIVIIFLGGEAYNYKDNYEFNVRQNPLPFRVILDSESPVIQFPCRGVVSSFITTKFELEHWFVGKNDLADYLASNTIQHCESIYGDIAWSKPLWDVTAAAWLNNVNEKFFLERLVKAPIMNDDHTYSFNDSRKIIKYIYFVKRDALFNDLIERLTK